MTTLRATVIMKTDISGSTLRFRALPETDLGAVLAEHRELVSRLAAAQGGHIAKAEGDGFWVVFPSVTAAAVAAMNMQEELRLAQVGKGEDRLAMRIVITLGDVMHQEGALVGDAIVLAARLEAMTPTDEIYLSPAAWLAINKAEIRTSPVSVVTLKGFPEPVSVYRVEQTHRIHVITDQHIVVTDLRGFSALAEALPMATVEKILDRLYDFVRDVSRGFGGTNRFGIADSYCLTFSEAGQALAAAERLAVDWQGFERELGVHCPMSVAVHKDVFYAFRSYLYGRGIAVATAVERASHVQGRGPSVLLTGQVRDELIGTSWDERLERVELEAKPPRLAKIEIYRLCAPRTPSLETS